LWSPSKYTIGTAIGNISFVKEKMNDVTRECKTLSLEPAQQLRLTQTKVELVMARLLRMNDGLIVVKRNFDQKEK